MVFANMGALGVASGQRDALVRLLTQPSEDLAAAGCLMYEVGVNEELPDTVFVCELWVSEQAHQASLQLPAVRAAIDSARPMLSGVTSGYRFDVVGSPLPRDHFGD